MVDDGALSGIAAGQRLVASEGWCGVPPVPAASVTISVTTLTGALAHPSGCRGAPSTRSRGDASSWSRGAERVAWPARGDRCRSPGRASGPGSCSAPTLGIRAHAAPAASQRGPTNGAAATPKGAGRRVLSHRVLRGIATGQSVVEPAQWGEAPRDLHASVATPVTTSTSSNGSSGRWAGPTEQRRGAS